MRLIVEKMDGEVYVYLESERTYEANQPSRESDGSRRLTGRLLLEECDLSAYADNVHWVFDVNWSGEDDD